MKFSFRFFFLLILFFQCATCNAAVASDGKDIPDTLGERGLVASVDYGTNKIFYGRRLTVNQVYLSPAFFYEAPSGFFAGLALYRLLSPVSGWDEMDLSAGWDFNLSKSLMASASYTRFRYADKSQQQYSSLQNNLEFYLKQENKIVTSKIVFDYLFGNSTHDLSLAFHLTHEFEFYELLDSDDALILKPAALLTAGTLNYYKISLKDSTQRLSLKNVQVYQADSKFTFSGAEFSFGAEYDIGRFIFEPAGHYNIPLNQPKYLNASSFFYFTIGVGYRII